MMAGPTQVGRCVLDPVKSVNEVAGRGIPGRRRDKSADERDPVTNEGPILRSRNRIHIDTESDA